MNKKEYEKTTTLDTLGDGDDDDGNGGDEEADNVVGDDVPRVPSVLGRSSAVDDNQENEQDYSRHNTKLANVYGGNIRRTHFFCSVVTLGELLEFFLEGCVFCFRAHGQHGLASERMLADGNDNHLARALEDLCAREQEGVLIVALLDRVRLARHARLVAFDVCQKNKNKKLKCFSWVWSLPCPSMKMPSAQRISPYSISVTSPTTTSWTEI